jgi:hypothetical protein
MRILIESMTLKDIRDLEEAGFDGAVERKKGITLFL